MTSESFLPKMKMLGLVKRTRVDDWNWRNGGAFFGICGGLLSPLLGSILTAITWFTGPQWHGLFLQRDGTVLLFLTIPLLIFGAHCLDLEDQQERKRENTLSNQIG